MKSYWIEVFRVGEHTDSAGNSKQWSLEDLQIIEKKYNEAVQASESTIAPVVKGHPVDNDPAYGWVDELKLKGEVLLAKIKNLIPEFVDEVKKGMFKKISISLYPDLMLRHVGFLGAMPPAVKGLENVAFKESTESTNDYHSYELDFAEAGADASADFSISVREDWRRERAFKHVDYTDDEFADDVHFKFPVRTRSDVLTSLALFSRPSVYKQYSNAEQQLIAARLVTAMAKHGINRNHKLWKYSENKELEDKKSDKEQIINNHKEADMPELTSLLEAMALYVVSELNKEGLEEIATAMQGKLDKWIVDNVKSSEPAPAEKENAEMHEKLVAQIIALQDNLRMKEFAEHLNSFSNLTPAIRMQALPILSTLTPREQESDKKIVSFNENGTTKQMPASEVFLQILRAIPPAVEYSEVKTPGAKVKVEYSDNFSEDSQDLHTKILQFQAEQLKNGKQVTYAEAFTQLQGVGVL